MKDKLSKQLTKFGKNHSTQHCVSGMLQIWKEGLDNGGYIFAVLMDLSRTCDTLNHNLLIAKIGAYGFETGALRYLKSYLTNRKQRVRLIKTFSEWERITTGVPQGSILGLLLLITFLNGLFLFISNSFLSTYADDNTPYTFGDNLKKIKDIYKTDLIRYINGFTKIIWYLMQKHIILCVSGITLKTKHSYAITSL